MEWHNLWWQLYGDLHVTSSSAPGRDCQSFSSLWPQRAKIRTKLHRAGNMDFFLLWDEHPISMLICWCRKKPLRILRKGFYKSFCMPSLSNQQAFTIFWHEAGIKLQNGCPCGNPTNVVNKIWRWHARKVSFHWSVMTNPGLRVKTLPSP